MWVCSCCVGIGGLRIVGYSRYLFNSVLPNTPLAYSLKIGALGRMENKKMQDLVNSFSSLPVGGSGRGRGRGSDVRDNRGGGRGRGRGAASGTDKIDALGRLLYANILSFLYTIC